MKNEILKILNCLKYGRYNKKIYDDYKNIINKENFKRLKIIVIFELILNLIFLILTTIFLKDLGYAYTLGYIFNIIISIAVIAYIYIPLKNKLKYTTFFFYIYIFLSLIIYKNISIDFGYNFNATLVFGMLLVYAYMFLDKPYRFSLFYLILTIWFCVSSFQIKDSSIAIIDCINSVVFYISSCALSYYQFMERLEKNIMIKNVADQRDTDHLTKLKNRMITEINITDYLVLNPDIISVLLVIDLDNFKFINDTYGHKVGDDVLKKVADCLRKIFRKEDYISRIGGDEFVVFISNLNNKTTIYKKVKELIRMIDQIEINELNIVGCSIGIAYASKDDDYQSLFVKADQAMYEAKKCGKNCFKVFKNSIISN